MKVEAKVVGIATVEVGQRKWKKLRARKEVDTEAKVQRRSGRESGSRSKLEAHKMALGRENDESGTMKR